MLCSGLMLSGRRLWRIRERAIPGLFFLGVATVVAACNAPMVLTQQVEARRLASEVQLQFTKAADAGNRSVMADSDDDAMAAAREAEQATHAVLDGSERLEGILKSMGYSEELQFLGTFRDRFAEYQKLDAEILPLAVENTNLKAQRLSFGPAHDAAIAFRTSLEAAAKMARPADAARVDALVARSVTSVLEIEVLQAPHIAEAEDAAMTRIEAQMTASDAAARRQLEQVKSLLPPGAGAHLTAATVALDRFTAINTELIALSRRNSEVRSLALTLGRKRMLAAQCDDQLRGLQAALMKHAVTATR
jgi:hypothetical protein